MWASFITLCLHNKVTSIKLYCPKLLIHWNIYISTNFCILFPSSFCINNSTMLLKHIRNILKLTVRRIIIINVLSCIASVLPNQYKQKNKMLIDFDYMVSQLYVQHCTFVEIGEGVCSVSNFQYFLVLIYIVLLVHFSIWHPLIKSNKRVNKSVTT